MTRAACAPSAVHLRERGHQHVADGLADLRGGDVGEVVREVVDAGRALAEVVGEDEVVPAARAEARERGHRHRQAEGEEIARASAQVMRQGSSHSRRGVIAESATRRTAERATDAITTALPPPHQRPSPAAASADRDGAVDHLAERAEEAHRAEAHVADLDAILDGGDALEQGGERQAREAAADARRVDQARRGAAERERGARARRGRAR